MNLDQFPDINGYSPVALCGQGAYGQVWLVQDLTGNYLALKVVSKRALGGDWKREFDGLVTYRQKVKRHPNLIEIYHIEDRETFFYYTMEVADNLSDETEYIPCTLENMIIKFGKLGPSSTISTFNKLIDGVEELHNAGIIHRDIKPDNIIFVGTTPKLSDVGLVTSISRSISLVGTQPYLPPEVITGGEKRINQAVDYYALGKSIYRCFTGKPPEDFPAVPKDVLKDAECKKLNKFVKVACHTTPIHRFRNIDSFRTAMNKGLGTKSVVISFFLFLYLILSLLVNGPVDIVKRMWRVSILRNAVILATICVSAYYGYIAFREFELNYKASKGLLSKSEYEEYIKLLDKKNRTKEEEKRKIKIESRIKSQKNAASIYNFKSIEDAGAPRKYKLIYEENFGNFGEWRFKSKKNIVVSDNSFILGENGECDMALADLELPDDYEINLSIRTKLKNSSVRFIVYSPESLYPDNPERKFTGNLSRLDGAYPASFNVELISGRFLSNLKIRRFAGRFYAFSDVATPTAKLNIEEDQTVNVKIIKKGSFLRFFFNGQRIYNPVDNVFNGGRFRIQASTPRFGAIKVEDISIYDIGYKEGLSKYASNSYNDPENNQSIKKVKRFQEKFKYFNHKLWTVIPEGGGSFESGRFVPNKECLLILKKELPANFDSTLKYDASENFKSFDLILLNNLPREKGIGEIIRQPFNAILRFKSNGYVCSFNSYDQYGLKQISYEYVGFDSRRGHVELKKRRKYISLDDKPVLFYGVNRSKHLAFYFPPMSSNSITSLKYTELATTNKTPQSGLDFSGMISKIVKDDFKTFPPLHSLKLTKAQKALLANNHSADEIYNEIAEQVSPLYDEYYGKLSPFKYKDIGRLISSDRIFRNFKFDAEAGKVSKYEFAHYSELLTYRVNLTSSEAKSIIDKYVKNYSNKKKSILRK